MIETDYRDGAGGGGGEGRDIFDNSCINSCLIE